MPLIRTTEQVVAKPQPLVCFCVRAGGSDHCEQQAADVYFGRQTARMVVRQPLELLDVVAKF